jgi:hypothetical protein
LRACGGGGCSGVYGPGRDRVSGKAEFGPGSQWPIVVVVVVVSVGSVGSVGSVDSGGDGSSDGDGDGGGGGGGKRPPIPKRVG